GIEEHDKEGRVITLEFEKFYMVNCYTPNSGRELARLEYRMIWEDEFKKYLLKLDKIKPVIVCGDLNVAHKEIDLKNPKSNRKNAGFTDEERGKIDNLLNSGFTDTFRKIYPDKEGCYTWWSYMFNARANNAGWRIDYFLVSDRISNNIKDAYIYPEIMGSDHCPVGLEIE
ncbi:MAG: exodeoxyribonuclease III, partial [Clostridia bacterium]